MTAAGAPPAGTGTGIGIGIEVTAVTLRALVVATRRSPETCAEVAVPVGASMEVAFAALAAGVTAQSPSGLPSELPAWIAWARPEVAVERIDVTGSGPAAMARLLGEWSERGVAAVGIEEGTAGTKHALLVRWDQPALDQAVGAAAAAGFAVTGCVPAATARAWVPEGDAARGAARAAAGLLAARPVRPVASPARPPPAPPWVIERVDDRSPPERDPPPARRRWRRWRRRTAR